MIASVWENRICSVHIQIRCHSNRSRQGTPATWTGRGSANLPVVRGTYGDDVIGAAQLTHKADVAEQRNSFAAFRNETSVRKPREQVESRWRTRQRLGRLHIRRYRMSEDLPEEFIAENDLVLKFARQGLSDRSAREYQIRASLMKLNLA